MSGPALAMQRGIPDDRRKCLLALKLANPSRRSTQLATDLSG